jgi:hypothetical protein
VFYMFQIFLVVTIPIFVLAASVLLCMVVWTKAKDFVRTRMSSQPRPAEFIRAA